MTNLGPSVLHNAEKIWRYMRLGMPLERAGALLVCGSTDLIVPYYAAALYHRGLAAHVVVSGGVAHTADLLRTSWSETEATVFRDALMSLEVPEHAIHLEAAATNSAENFRLGAAILAEINIRIDDTLIVHKPYMERRAHATAKTCWPGHNVRITSPPATFRYYGQHVMEPVRLINIMVGDLQRLSIYGNRGLNEKQEIPVDVEYAYNELISAGFNKHLIT